MDDREVAVARGAGLVTDIASPHGKVDDLEVFC